MQIAFETNVGRQRTNNEDSVDVYYNKAKLPFVIVADGMGGHQGGDVASQMVVTSLGEQWQLTDFAYIEGINTWLSEQIELVNMKMIAYGKQHPLYQGMGTTLVAAVLLEKQFVIASIGDSRGYLLASHHFEQITEDHSLVNELVKRGEITETEAVNHPRKNILTRSIGNIKKIEPDISSLYIPSNGILLLCSDGLTNMLSDKDIQEILSSSEINLTEKTNQLVTKANQNGGNDNVTVLLVQFPSGKEV